MAKQLARAVQVTHTGEPNLSSAQGRQLQIDFTEIAPSLSSDTLFSALTSFSAMQIPLSLPSTSKVPLFTPKPARPSPAAASTSSPARSPASTSIADPTAPKPTRTLTPSTVASSTKQAVAAASYTFTPASEPTGGLVKDGAGVLRLARSSAGPGSALGLTEAHVHAGLGVGLVAVVVTLGWWVSRSAFGDRPGRTRKPNALVKGKDKVRPKPRRGGTVDRWMKQVA